MAELAIITDSINKHILIAIFDFNKEAQAQTFILIDQTDFELSQTQTLCNQYRFSAKKSAQVIWLQCKKKTLICCN